MSLVTVAEASEYFSAHLFADAWNAAAGTRRLAALAQAERDIMSLNFPRGVGGPPYRTVQNAICEQALFLLQRTPSDRERARAQQAGVKSRGVGDAREDYNCKIQRISPDALQYLQGYVQRRLGSIR